MRIRPGGLALALFGLSTLASTEARAQGTQTATAAATSSVTPDIPSSPPPAAAARPSTQPPKRAAAKGANQPHVVKVHKDERGFKLKVDGKDLMVFGMNWQYMPIGENYSYDFWGKPDDFIEKALHDEMTLLRDMHVNVIRVYVGMPQRWITYIYEKYGIYTVLNHPMGRYGFDFNGAYIPTTNYQDPSHREYLKNEIVELVESYKNTPGLLFWLLGNENNYGLYWSSNEIEDLPLDKQNDARAKFLYTLYGEITDEIHEVDQNHPVAIANGDLQFIELVAKYAPNIDIFGSNVYRGKSSGDLFDRVSETLGVPFVYTEFGSDAYNAKEKREDQLSQAQYLNAQWREIYEQSHGKGKAENAIGGMIFQWSDGWWKYRQEENLDIHDNTASWATGAYTFDFVEGENNMNEEWFGICAKNPNDESGHYKVSPRAAYYMLAKAFELDPYAESTTPAIIAGHFTSLPAKDFTARYAVERVDKRLDILEMARVKSLTIELYTFTTGGQKLDNANRDEERFDHMQSFYLDFEVTPSKNLRANASINVLGNVADNPIDEIFFENRGQEAEVLDPDFEPVTLNGVERVKLYQATFDWKSDYFELEGFYRAGHGHWGYEGDYFGIYPEAYYQPSVDMFNANTPSGIVFSGRRFLDGLKIAFGPELWWGANPTVILKYYKNFGKFSFSLIHQEDIAQLAGAGTSSVLPVPRTRKSAVSFAVERGEWKLEAGGIMAGTDRLDRQYFAVRDAPSGGASYLDSGYYLLEDQIDILDTLGAKATLTYTGGLVNFYAQGGYRGLVADSMGNQTLNFTSWGLNESGQGNHYGGLAGLLFNLGNFSVGPNFLYQKPLEGPLPLIADFYDPNTGIYYPGVNARNQFDDPFWVRSNRETIGFEVVLGYDPTPASWMFAWDALKRENAPFGGFVNFNYRILPTSQDGAVAISEEGFPFAFASAPPAQNLWEVRGRLFFNPAPKLRIITDFYAGIAQSNGDDARLVERGGLYGRLVYDHLSLETWVKINDWGPYDYHRDFNFTFPLQTVADLSYSIGMPRWFVRSYTRFGIRGKFRFLDEFSNRFDPVQEPLGNEWEVMTYVIFGVF